MPHLLPYSCAKAAVGALAEGLHAEAAAAGVSVTAVHPGLMRTGSHRQAEFGGDTAAEFEWFSALAGTPPLSMDAERAARRIVEAVARRRVRPALTPAARAAQLAHGAAPGLTTRLTGLSARLLPSAGERGPLRQGHEAGLPRNGVARRLRAWGSALNDRAVEAANQRKPGLRTSSREAAEPPVEDLPIGYAVFVFLVALAGRTRTVDRMSTGSATTAHVSASRIPTGGPRDEAQRKWPLRRRCGW